MNNKRSPEDVRDNESWLYTGQSQNTDSTVNQSKLKANVADVKRGKMCV